MINTTNSADEVLNSFVDFKFDSNHLPIITVYYNSKDYPGIYVARLLYCLQSPFPTKYIVKGESLQEIDKKIPRFFMFFNRAETDEKQIVGAYI